MNTLSDFVNYVFQYDIESIDQRRGQFVFNTLCETRPDLSEQIRATDLDPFYDDERLMPFLEWLQANWEKDEIVEEFTDYQDYSIEGYRDYLKEKLDVAEALANKKGYPDGTIVEFDANGGLTFLANYKGGNWWTTTTIGPEANAYYPNLSVLLDKFNDITRVVIHTKGKKLYERSV